MMKLLLWLSWLAFLASAFTIIAGGLMFLETHQNTGIFITYAGVIGLVISGWIMDRVYRLRGSEQKVCRKC